MEVVGGNGGSSVGKRPNIVIFMADQLRADALGCFGNAQALTPTIDALAARGTRFDDAWVQHPVCGPSRVSFMTGWYPHTAGHRTLDNLLKPWEPNLLAMLRSAGYKVAMAGNRGDVFAPGVTEASTDFCGWIDKPDQADVIAGWTPARPADDPLTRAFWYGAQHHEPFVDGDEATVRTAETWIAEGAPTDEPWALWVPLFFPHVPFTAPEPWFSLHDRADRRTPLGPDAAVGKAGFIEAYRSIYGWDELSAGDLAEIVATYDAMVSRVDDHLRRVMAAVDTAGQADSTGWVFCSDHGEYLGDYGLVEKWPSALDPQITRNPLIVAMPGRPEGGVVTSPVETIDVLATVVELAEIEAAHTHFGRSLVPLLDDANRSVREFAFTEGGFRLGDVDLLETGGGPYEPKTRLQNEQPELVGLALCVRTTDWSYVWRSEESDELYDRIADPNETRNVVNDPKHPQVRAELRSMLFEHLAATSDVIPWEADPRFPKTPQGWRTQAGEAG